MINFGRILTAPCVNVEPTPDNRCADPAFAVLYPDLCPVPPQLIIKPSVALTCALGTIQFRAFYVANGRETDVTDDSVFTSSDMSIAVVGASSGNATGLTAGQATITATYQDKTALAELDVLGNANPCGCCQDQQVAMMLLVDNSRSMSQAFGAGYPTRLHYARAAAVRFINEVNQTKDVVSLMKFNASENSVLAALTSAKSSVAAQVPNILQTQNLTTFYDALNTAITQLNASTADLKVIVLLSDGEDTSGSYQSGNNPIALIQNFKSQGGVVISLGCRASGKGFNLLETLSTGGFFINSYPDVAQVSLNYLSGLKGYICAGNCTPSGDIVVYTGALNYTGFKNWNVSEGTVDLQGNGFFDFLPGNGLYVDMAGTIPPQKGKLQTKNAISLHKNHQYRLTVQLSGNQRVNATPESVRLRVFYLNNDTNQTPIYLLDQKVSVNDYTQPFQPYAYAFTSPDEFSVYISIQQEDSPADGDPRIGLMLNQVAFDDMTDKGGVFFDDFDTENPTYVPPRCGRGLTPLAYLCGYGYAGVGTEPWHAFDQNPATAWKSCNAFTHTGPFAVIGDYVWLQYKHGQGEEQLTGCQVTCLDSASAPKDFIFQGSISGLGSEWDDLDTQIGVTWNPGESKTFVFPPKANYNFSRLFITKTGGALYAAVKEMRIFAGLDHIFPTPMTSNTTCAFPPCPTCDCGVCSASCSSSGCSIVNMVPVMTSNTTPSGVASASTEKDADSRAWKAFDHIKNSGLNEWRSGNVGPGPWWLQYQFTSAKTILQYALTSRGDSSCPINFTLSGSNDGSNWTVLDTRPSEPIFATPGPETRIYPIATPTAYLYYRLTIFDIPVTFSNGPVVSELELFGADCPQAYGTCYSYALGYCCYGYGCLNTPPPVQLQDPNPLPNIETSGSPPPPRTYESTQTACASCPAEQINTPEDNCVPIMTSNTTPSGVASASSINSAYRPFGAFDHVKPPAGAIPHDQIWSSNPVDITYPFWLRYDFPSAKTVNTYTVSAYGVSSGFASAPTAWQLQGSNDGSNWTTLDTQTGLSWFPNSLETKSFQIGTPGSYLSYRLLITAGRSSTVGVAELELFCAAAPATVCKTASATSTISQADADAQAYAAALALAQAELNCQHVYTSTQQFTAQCPVGQFGQDVTRSATRTSLVSQAEADAAALAAAQADAEAALVCTLSNNDRPITINDAQPGLLAAATPFPSVKYVSGLTGTITKVAVSLISFGHQHPDDVRMMLRSPSGTLVELMRDAGGLAGVSGLNITFDDTAGSTIPDNGPVVAGTFKPSLYGVQASYPAPCPAMPYQATLATFNGENPNGSWSLWVVDDTPLDTGQIAGGWTIQITSV